MEETDVKTPYGVSWRSCRCCSTAVESIGVGRKLDDD
jgi:hypothetical protein